LIGCYSKPEEPLSKYLIPRSRRAIPIHVVTPSHFQAWLKTQPQAVKKWLKSVGYQAKPGELRLIPGRNAELGGVLISCAAPHEPWGYASLPTLLPKQHQYEIASDLAQDAASAAALGWALGCYSFSRYRKKSEGYAALVWPKQADRNAVTALFEGIALCRNLINTPASDLGPEELAGAGIVIAQKHGAVSSLLVGEQLLKNNYPMVHAVGRASTRAPRLLDFRWGNPKHPKLTLVGKGVCFDSGGLDIKPAADMKLMKKDMGGAALVLGLAHVLMSLQLPVRLRVLIPAVENSVSGNAMRPLDVLSSRKGLTVEIGNTDAEGRLILADALTEACTESPDLLIDAATLTGAARIALGTALPALFSTDDAAADALLATGRSTGDPLWRLPLHEPYRKSLDSKVADLNNISSDSYGGAITAALFLREFITKKQPWLHIDTMGWNLESRPGRPYGGEALGLRALVEMLVARYGR
jgi:leucyl aminopeptidase